MICTNCGANCAEGTTYCIHCGNRVGAPEAPQPPPYSYYNTGGTEQYANAYTNPNPNMNANPYPNQNAYGNPNVQSNETVSIGDWVLTIFVQCIPVVGLIMMFIWGFGGDAKKSKSNYCKAALIWMAISTVLIVLLIIAIGSVALEIMKELGYYY